MKDDKEIQVCFDEVAEMCIDVINSESRKRDMGPYPLGMAVSSFIIYNIIAAVAEGDDEDDKLHLKNGIVHMLKKFEHMLDKMDQVKQ